MPTKTAAIIGAIALVTIGGSACAMTNSPANPKRCFVLGHEKLPPGIGGEQAICRAIQSAVAKRAPAADYSVEVQVLSNSMLAARIRMADGRELPEQKMAVSDRRLDYGSVERFAAAISEAIGGIDRN